MNKPANEISDAELGRQMMFTAIEGHRLFKLPRDTSLEQIQKAYTDRINVVIQSSKDKNEKDGVLRQLEYYHESLKFMHELLPSFSKPARVDWENSFVAYNDYLERAEKEGSGLVASPMGFDTDYLLHPGHYRNLVKPVSNSNRLTGTSLLWIEQRALPILGMLVAIGLMIALWNVHPVLGILSIIAFVWYIKDKFLP